MCRNIVEYIGVGYKEDRQTAIDPAAGCYLVQEYIAGGTLKQKILSRVRLPFRSLQHGDWDGAAFKRACSAIGNAEGSQLRLR